jgi:hypothetical protein
VNNFVVLVDVCQSVQFLVWREEDYSLTLLAKDYDAHVGLSTGFLVDGARLGILLGDAERNIQMLQFNPRCVSFEYSPWNELIITSFIYFTFLNTCFTERSRVWKVLDF